MTKVRDTALYITGACYALVLLDVFFRFGVVSSGSTATHALNLIPGKTLYLYISGQSGVSSALSLENILGNIAVFIPVGLYLQTLFHKQSFYKSLWITAGLSVMIEAVQFAFSLGAADVDDVILNVCGGIAGILVYRLVQKIIPEPEKAKTVVTVILLVVCVPVILLYGRVMLRRLF